MKVVAIISQKGGAGKTTIALHLAVAAERTGQTAVIIDLDPQASASNWKDSRLEDTPVIVSAQAARLTTVLDVAKKGGAEICIIDTAPHSESAALAASRSADLILIPCRPAILDLRAISNTIELARIAGKPVAVVLNSVPSRGSIAQEAISAVESYGVDVVPVQIGQRAAFMHALTTGQTAQEYEPTGKGADEVQQLYIWTCKHVGMLKNEQKNYSSRRSSRS
jgi:chromosome partitioning protein